MVDQYQYTTTGKAGKLKRYKQVIVIQTRKKNRSMQDDHTRNIAFPIDKQWRRSLAPAFDVIRVRLERKTTGVYSQPRVTCGVFEP